MSERKAITERMKVDALLWRASFSCPICRLVVAPGQSIEWDHIHPVALDGEHAFMNIRPLHKHCHDRKTRGTKATTAGSDIHAIAKVKRPARKLAGTWRKTKRKWPSRKMPSRPFPKRGAL